MPESEQQAVRRIFNEGAQGGEPVTVNGEPLAKVMQLPKLPNEEAAQRMARILKEKGKAGLGEDEYNRRIRQLKEFRKENPAPPVTPSPEEQFFADNLDTTPVASSLKEKRRQRAVMSPTGFDPAQFRKEDRFTPESREGRVAAAEAKGVDTTTGFGDLSEAFGLAIEFNSPQRQAQYIAGVTLDNLEAQGIQLPAGVAPVRMNEELGQLEYLRPTEDGKVRWTLVDSEVLRAQDIASLADLPEVLSAVGGTIGAGATRMPILAEFLGDVVGRNTGTVIEAALVEGK